MTMNNSWFQKLLLLLVIVGGINWGIYGIWGFDLVGWVLGGSLGWLARTVFVIVGIAALALIPALFSSTQEEQHRRPEPGRA